MPTMAPPEGYVQVSRGEARVLVRADVQASLEGLELDDLDALRRAGEPTRLRGRTRHTRIDLGGGLRALVKESRRGGIPGRILGDLYLGADRFGEEVRVTAEAERRGVRVAPILASVVRPAAFGFCRHHFIVQEIDGLRDLREALPEGGHSPAGRRRIVGSIARAIRDLHDAGICHADLSLGNVLVGEGEGGEPEVAFIDLDTSRLDETVDLASRCRNILRLFRAFLKAGLPPRRSEQARFVRAYFRGEREEERRAWEILRRAAVGLALHRLAWRLGIR